MRSFYNAGSIGDSAKVPNPAWDRGQDEGASAAKRQGERGHDGSTIAYGPSGQFADARRPGRAIDYVYDEGDRCVLKRIDGVPVRAEVAGRILSFVDPTGLGILSWLGENVVPRVVGGLQAAGGFAGVEEALRDSERCDDRSAGRD